MLRTIDIAMIGAMVAAATVTYQIKHHAENKLQEVRRIEAEIKLEHETIDLLKADWALLTQPHRLERLIKVYGPELQLEPTQPAQIARPSELPKLRQELPPKEVAADGVGATDQLATGSVRP